MILAKILALFCLIFVESSAKRYTRCQVTNLLSENGFNRALIPTWVCLIQTSSGRDSAKVTNLEGHTYYGLFQIKSMKYCTPGKRNGGGECKNDCQNFINNDVKDDMSCAKKILEREGFQTWPKFKRFCKGLTVIQPWVEDVKKCLQRKKSIVDVRYKDRSPSPLGLFDIPARKASISKNCSSDSI